MRNLETKFELSIAFRCRVIQAFIGQMEGQTDRQVQCVMRPPSGKVTITLMYWRQKDICCDKCTTKR